MRSVLIAVVFLSGCATVPIAGAGDVKTAVPVEISGHVTQACAVNAGQANVTVTLRAAGELEPLATAVTDATGAFTFRVQAPSDHARLLVEAQGRKALATQQYSEGGPLIAELRLPCPG
jgi:hypothetical protein